LRARARERNLMAGVSIHDAMRGSEYLRW
jgi:hypothetical protein